MARRLGLPIRTWYNYESGVTVPAEVMLRFVEMTSVEPLWLLNGQGPKFRITSPSSSHGDSVEALLRTALHRLESKNLATRPAPSTDGIAHGAGNGNGHSAPETDGVVLIRVDGDEHERLTNDSGPSYIAARREWLAASRDCRCVHVEGDAMVPIVSDGAYVAYSDVEDSLEVLENQLVVAWVKGKPLVRWFGVSGKYGVLRAENPAHEPATILLDLEGADANTRIRKVVWISTPH